MMGTISSESKPYADDPEMVEKTGAFARHDGNASEGQSEGFDSVAPVYSAKGSSQVFHIEILDSFSIRNLSNI